MDLIPTVLADEGEHLVEAGISLAEAVRSNQITFTLIASAVLFILTVVSIILYKKSSSGQVPASVAPTPTPAEVAFPAPVAATQSHEGLKMPLFLSLVLVILANTFYLVGSTLYVNSKSVTGGPVHWHADFEVWDCGQEIELVDPKPPSNIVGSPLLHEHNDKQIHIEEAIFDEKEVSLGVFFRVVGGELHSDYLKFPTNNGIVERRNGDLCSDGQPGNLQVFLYKAGSFEQQTLEDPENYLMTPEQKVPPGDCLIIEFGPIREQTDKLCQSYQVIKEKKQHGR